MYILNVLYRAGEHSINHHHLATAGIMHHKFLILMVSELEVH